MNERLEELKRRTRDGEQKAFRRPQPISVLEECEAENLSWPRRVARLMARQCEAETVVIGADEKIVFTRTVPAAIPELYSPADWARIAAGRTLHESGPINNLSPDWGMVLSQGLLGR